MDEFAKDTDGFLARHFDRKISGAISRILLRTSIVPNQITVGVTLLGILAGALMARTGQGPKIAGAFLFLLTSILDGCDGEIARARNMTSKLGGWLDLLGDNVVHIAVFWGLGVGLYRDTGYDLYLNLGGWAVFGTLMSASLVVWQMVRKNQSSFTSVVGDIHKAVKMSGWKRALSSVSDALARRDFVYLVPILSIFDGLSWFLWAVAIGVNLYVLVLVILFVATFRSG